MMQLGDLGDFGDHLLLLPAIVIEPAAFELLSTSMSCAATRAACSDTDEYRWIANINVRPKRKQQGTPVAKGVSSVPKQTSQMRWAQMPMCARCADARIACHYVRSRRGYRGERRKLVGAEQEAATLPQFNASDLRQSLPTVAPRRESQTPRGSDVLDNFASNSTIPLPSVDADNVNADDAISDELIELFYTNIYPAHPFVLPRLVYLSNRSLFPSHLKHAMCFIASHHKDGPSEELSSTVSQVYSLSGSADGFVVQSLLLMTLASYARFDRDQGNAALRTAINIALQIGLDSNGFAIEQEVVFQESWRRTWWELYSIAGLISLIGGTNLDLPYPDSMLLPTHCDAFTESQVSQVRSCTEMQERFVADDNFGWSSFAYKVEAMRILRTVLDSDMNSSTIKCHAANASISSFLLSIPPDKRDGFKDNGDIDEVMSCSLMIIHLASICLHFPRSGLLEAKYLSTVCGTAREVLQADQARTHRAAALSSATALSNLVSMRSSLTRLSPCFSCAIAYASVVQLSAFLTLKPPESAYLKEHVQLQLAALDNIGRTWPIARVVRAQIAQYSREILTGRRPHIPSPEPVVLPPDIDSQWLEELMTEDFELQPPGFFMPVML